MHLPTLGTFPVSHLLPRLSNGSLNVIMMGRCDMPTIGFGTALIPHDKLLVVLEEAIRRGVRLFDTAEAYMNEEVLGRALARSGLPRSDFFILSKTQRSPRAAIEGAATLTPPRHALELKQAAVPKVVEQLASKSGHLMTSVVVLVSR